MIDIQNDDELQDILKNNRLVIVFFYAKWCSPCKKMHEALSEVLSFFIIPFKIVKIDIDRNSDFVLKKNIYVIPKLYYYKEGNVFLRESGLKTIDHIKKNIETLDNLPKLIDNL